MIRHHLTKKLIDETPLPATGQTFLRDNEVIGLGICLSPGGARTFFWEGRIEGRVRRVTLGRFPELSVAGARVLAARTRVRVANGENPADERREQTKAPTFGTLVTAFIEHHAKPHKRTWREDERRARKHLAGLFHDNPGSAPAGDVGEASARGSYRGALPGMGRGEDRR